MKELYKKLNNCIHLKTSYSFLSRIFIVLLVLLFQGCGLLENSETIQLLENSSYKDKNLLGSNQREDSSSIVTVSSFGAIGNGITDDRLALQSAINASGSTCLDGQGKTYAVFGTLEGRENLCMRNMNLVQTMTPFDYSKYINSDNKPPQKLQASERIYHSEDPVLSEGEHIEAEKRFALRTILFEGGNNSSIILENISINKGLSSDLGNAGNSVALYIRNTESVKINNLEIKGKGQGYSILINNSKNIAIKGLNIHDVEWEPRIGRRNFANLVSQFGWNDIPVYEYDPSRQKFAEVRSQEVASGLVLSNSENIKILESRISEIVVPWQGKRVPWQADGITIANCKKVFISHIKVHSTWEGIDFSGSSNSDVSIYDSVFENNFSYGIKFAHKLHGATLVRNTVLRSGFQGIVFGGAEEEKQSNVIIYDTLVLDTGGLILNDGSVLQRPFGASVNAALMIGGQQFRYDAPEHFRIANFKAINKNPLYSMDYGIAAFNGHYIHVALSNTDVEGARVEGARVDSRPPNYSFIQVQAYYRDFLSREPTLNETINLWDQSHDSVRFPAWTLDDLARHLNGLK